MPLVDLDLSTLHSRQLKQHLPTSKSYRRFYIVVRAHFEDEREIVPGKEVEEQAFLPPEERRLTSISLSEPL